MTNERPEWLQRCGEVKACRTTETYDNARRLASDPLFLLLAITAYVAVYPFIKLYRWLRR